jgi:hypothetical protein
MVFIVLNATVVCHKGVWFSPNPASDPEKPILPGPASRRIPVAEPLNRLCKPLIERIGGLVSQSLFYRGDI